MVQSQRSRGWIVWAGINALITFFGASYIWFPGPDVVKAGNETEGLVHVPAVVWGVFVMASALSMLAVAVVGLRRGEPWARRAAGYEFLFLFLVVVLEPDPVVPVLFGVILGLTLWRSRPRQVALAA